MIEWNALILAGGRAARLGGIDKTALVFEGRTLLEQAVAACAGARAVAVVGAPAPAGALTVWEEPRFGGPVAAIAAGLAAAPPAPCTALLAADQPRIAAALPRILDAVDAAGETDGWFAVDPAGRRQNLLGVLRTSSLDRALDLLRGGGAPLGGASMRALLAPLSITEIVLPAELCADIDTAEDARRHDILVAHELGKGQRG
jgi:molybdopterin-guanine dinucleotide biosynthesis protein A